MISDFVYDHIVGLTVVGIVIVLFTSVGLPLFIQWSPGEQKLTGYIYSVGDEWGDKTVGHIRFSEYAGEDSQPKFCVKKKDGEFLKELAGSGKKVFIKIPAGFSLAPVWDCAIPAEIEIIEEEK